MKLQSLKLPLMQKLLLVAVLSKACKRENYMMSSPNTHNKELI